MIEQENRSKQLQNNFQSSNPCNKKQSFPQSSLPPQSQLIHPSYLYPSISIVKNTSNNFLSQDYIPIGYKTLKNNDSRINTFFMVIYKLFGSICPSLNIRNFWICQKNHCQYPIFGYFVAPDQYPIMNCCEKVIYIEFQYGFTGKVRCIKCNKIAFSFLNVRNCKKQSKLIYQQQSNKFTDNKQNQSQKNNKHNQNHRTIKTKQKQKDSNLPSQQHKYSKKIEQQFSQNSSHNKQLYKLYKHQIQNKKINIRKLVSSNQYRYKSLKNIFNHQIYHLNHLLHTQYLNHHLNNGIFADYNYHHSISPQSKHVTNNQHDIGQFIIQIQQQNSQQFTSNTIYNNFLNNPLQTVNTYSSNKKYDQNILHHQQNHNQPLSQTCKQLKQIIISIFS